MRALIGVFSRAWKLTWASTTHTGSLSLSVSGTFWTNIW